MASTYVEAAPEVHGEPLLLRVEEAARLLRISRSRMFELIAAGAVPGVVRIGRSVRISRRTLEAWVEEQVDAAAQNPDAA